jgi:hypothetical protein
MRSSTLISLVRMRSSNFSIFFFGGREVELAEGHLRPADGIADRPLQFLSAGFALRVTEFFQSAAQFLALQPG